MLIINRRCSRVSWATCPTSRVLVRPSCTIRHLEAATTPLFLRLKILTKTVNALTLCHLGINWPHVVACHCAPTENLKEMWKIHMLMGAILGLGVGFPAFGKAANEFPAEYIEHDFESVKISGVSRHTARDRLNRIVSVESLRASADFVTLSNDRFYIARLLAFIGTGDKIEDCEGIEELIWVVDLKGESGVVTYFSDGNRFSGPDGCQVVEGLDSLDVLDWLPGSESEADEP